MSAITSVVSDVLPIVSGAVPVFNATTNYLTKQNSLQAAADRTAASAAAKVAAKQQAEDNLQATQQLQMKQLQETQAADTATSDAAIQTQMDQAQLSANTTEQNRRDALRQAVA